MDEFKVGNRVRVIDDHGGAKIGDVGTITSIQNDGASKYYVIDGLSGDIDGLFGYRLELIPAAPDNDNWDFDPRGSGLGDTDGYTFPFGLEDEADPELKIGDRVWAKWLDTEGEGVITDDDGPDAKMRYLVRFDSGEVFWIYNEEIRGPDDVTPDSPLTCTITCDTSEMDAAIDRVLRRIKKLRKKARKAGIRLGVSELQDAA